VKSKLKMVQNAKQPDPADERLMLSCALNPDSFLSSPNHDLRARETNAVVANAEQWQPGGAHVVVVLSWIHLLVCTLFRGGVHHHQACLRWRP
jgi:hypothetical protein